MRYIQGFSGGKKEGKRLIERRGRRWEDRFVIDIKEICWDCGDSIDVAQDRDKNWVVANGNENSGYIKFGSCSINRGSINYSRETQLHGISWLTSWSFILMFKTNDDYFPKYQ